MNGKFQILYIRSQKGQYRSAERRPGVPQNETNQRGCFDR